MPGGTDVNIILSGSTSDGAVTDEVFLAPAGSSSSDLKNTGGTMTFSTSVNVHKGLIKGVTSGATANVSTGSGSSHPISRVTGKFSSGENVTQSSGGTVTPEFFIWSHSISC